MMRGAFRRSALVALAAVLAVGVTVVAAPAGAEEEFVPGSGEVEAQLVRVGPTAGRLSFAPGIGLAFANYSNTLARAEARVFDFAALDDSVPPEVKEQFPAVRLDSTDEGADKGKRVTTAGFPPEVPVRAGGTVQEVKAGEGPWSESTFTLGDFSPVPGIVEMAGGRVFSRSGVVKGVREAIAEVRIGRLSLGGDAVVLQGLTWTVRQRTGGKEEATGSFGIEGIKAGGQDLKPPEGGTTAEQWKQLNDGLAPLGVRIDPPKVEVDQGVVSITPLGLHLTANQVARTVGPPLLEGIQPVREPLAKAFIESSPEAGSLFTVGDLVLGALVGTGAIDIKLGGGTAFTEGEAFDSPFGSFDLGGGSALGDVGPVALGGGDSSFSPGSATSGSGDDAAAGGGGDEEVALAGSSRQAGTRGGPALVVGLLGLAAVLGMAAADWWRLHHEPRRITL